MKKSIVALLAASAVVALTGAGASAAGDFDIIAKDIKSADSPLVVKINTAKDVDRPKPGCDIKVSVFDYMYVADNNEPNDDNVNGEEDWSDTRRATGVIKVSKSGTGSTVLNLAKAGDYYAYSNVQFTKLACLIVSEDSDDTYFTVGTPVYVNNINGEYLSAEDGDLNVYNYQLSGDVWADLGTDKLRAGVGVELWVENLSGTRWVKIKTTKTNALGEFTFKGVWDEDAHDSNDFQIRITRDAKYFDDFDEYEPNVANGSFNDGL